MKFFLKNLLKHLLAFLGMAGFISALFWLFCWAGCWDIQAISQSEAYSMYPFAIIPAILGGISFYGACKLENHIEEEYYEH
jgi:hypothetical protein